MVDDGVRQHGQLRRAREARHLTQAEAAERLAELAWCRDRTRLGVGPDMVSKWERGEKRPHKTYRQLLCLLYSASPAELGFTAMPTDADRLTGPASVGAAEMPWAEVLLTLGEPGYLLHHQLIEEWGRDLMQRRELLKSMGLAGVATALDSLTPPVAGTVRLTERPRPDRDTLSGLATLASRYQRLYHDTAPATLMRPIGAHLRTVDGLLDRADNPRARRALLLNYSQVAQLAGRLAFFDLQDPLAARGYLMAAYDSATAAGDASLAAGALGHLGFVPAAAKQWAAATDHLERAAAHADSGAPPIVRSWLAAVSSEIRANAGDERGALRAIDDAKRALGSGSPAVVPDWFDFYDATRLHGFEGYALLQGGRNAAAARHLDQALDALDRYAVKQRTVFLTDLATASVRQGEIDRACALATRAATDLSTRRYATCVNRLRTFRTSLRPYRTSRAVRELDRAMVQL